MSALADIAKLGDIGKLSDLSKFSSKFDASALSKIVNTDFKSIGRVSELNPNVSKLIPDIYSSKVGTSLSSLPTSKAFDSSILKYDLNTKLSSKSVVDSTLSKSVNDAALSKGNIKNVTSIDLDFQIAKNIETVKADTVTGYKSTMKGVFEGIDPRAANIESGKLIDKMVDAPDEALKTLEARGNAVKAANPDFDAKINKSFKSKASSILSTGGKGLMVLGLIVMLIPGGSDIIEDIVGTIGESVIEPLATASAGILSTLFGPLFSTISSFIKPILIAGVVVLVAYIAWKFYQSKKSKGVTLTLPSLPSAPTLDKIR